MTIKVKRLKNEFQFWTQSYIKDFINKLTNLNEVKNVKEFQYN